MNVCLVGDDWQSIYGFRGSDISSFFFFVDEFNLKKFYLERNYRSTQTIVNAAKSVIDKNPEQFEKSVFSENPVGRQIISYAMSNEAAEANRVVQIVKTLTRHDIKPNEIAVLYRLSYLSRKVEDAFLTNGISYRMLSGLPFYGRKEIKDIMAYLRVIMNPNDRLAFERAITCPRRGIGEKNLEKITSCLYDEACGILSLDKLTENLRQLKDIKGKAKKGLDNFLAVIETLNEEKDVLSPKELVEAVLTRTDYLNFLKKEDRDSYDERIGNIHELETIADKYPNLEEFVGNMVVNEAESDSDEEEDSDKVHMMTIHGSKGLEYRAVIVIGCCQGTLPHYKAVMEKNVDEERRLFYVAMTRAKELLFLTYPKVTISRGMEMVRFPSMFLKEIDSRYIKKS